VSWHGQISKIEARPSIAWYSLAWHNQELLDRWGALSAQGAIKSKPDRHRKRLVLPGNAGSGSR